MTYNIQRTVAEGHPNSGKGEGRKGAIEFVLRTDLHIYSNVEFQLYIQVIPPIALLALL